MNDSAFRSCKPARLPVALIVATLVGLHSATVGAGLIGHWTLNEPSGTVAFDSAGSNDGATTGALVNQAGQIGAAYRFDGNDFIDLGAKFDGPVLTVSAWVNTDFAYTRNAFPSVVGALTNSASAGWNLYFTGGSSDQWGFYSSSGGFAGSAPITSDAELGRGVWQHLVGVSNGNTSQLYINGVLAGSGSGDGTYTTSLSNVRIGHNPDFSVGGGAFFPGLIDDVAIWDDALTDTQIEELYNNGLQGIDAGGPVNAVPEPSTFTCLLIAGLTLVGYRRFGSKREAQTTS